VTIKRASQYGSTIPALRQLRGYIGVLSRETFALLVRGGGYRHTQRTAATINDRNHDGLTQVCRIEGLYVKESGLDIGMRRITRSQVTPKPLVWP
jgi:hypothetical protein